MTTNPINQQREELCKYRGEGRDDNSNGGGGGVGRRGGRMGG
jgi:hypothetical protein